MSKVSPVLRRYEGGYAHWCPACEEMHTLPDSWTFDGNLEKPTFTESFKRGGKLWNMDTWKPGDPTPPDFVCHYVLTAGILNFCADCTHSMAGQSVPLPPLPDE